MELVSIKISSTLCRETSVSLIVSKQVHFTQTAAFARGTFHKKRYCSWAT